MFYGKADASRLLDKLGIDVEVYKTTERADGDALYRPFTPLDAMPADLRAHLRTPEEMFNVQTATFARYHVTTAASFQQNNDLWTVPTAPASDVPSRAIGCSIAARAAG